MDVIKFNTGRYYTDKGQRIAAALLDNGDIYFLDVDRHIDGTIMADGLTKDDIIGFDMFSQRGIMSAYDAGNYQWATVPLGMRDKLYELAHTI